MPDVAPLIAQSSGSNQPASDPAQAALKLARASLDALVLKLGQTIDAKVVGQLAGGLTQLSAGDENFVLKLEVPLPGGTAVTIRVSPTPQGRPAVTVTIPTATSQVGPLPLPISTALLMQAQVPSPAPPQLGAAAQALPQGTQLPVAQALPASAAAQPAAAPAPVPAAATMTQPAPTPASVGQGAAPVTPQVSASPAPPNAAAPQVAAQPASAPLATRTPPPVTVPVPAPPPMGTAQLLAQVPLPFSALPAQPVAAAGTAALPQPSVQVAGQPTAALAMQPPAAAPVPIPAPAATTPAVMPPPVAPGMATSPLVAAAPMPAAAPVAAALLQPAAPVASTTPPPPILNAPVAAQSQPVPTLASPYPVHVPQAATPAMVQQPPLPAAPAGASKPAAPRLNLTDPGQAAARQDSAAPLLARLAALVIAGPAVPPPLLAVAQRLLANRIDLNRAAPDGKALEAAVLKSGVVTTPTSREASTDSKSALLALRSTLLAVVGGDAEVPVEPVARPAPPIKGEPPRAPAPVASPALLSDGHEAVRTLLGHTDAALSRLKLLQVASQPPAEPRADAPVPRSELRVEIPMLLGAQTGILHLMVERDGKHRRDPERQRGWRMRFAMNFSETGEIGADVALLGRAATIAIWAADPDTADALDEMLPELAPAIQRHGLEVTSLRVRRGAPQTARTAPGRLLDSAR